MASWINATDIAAHLRTQLKNTFPGVKFSVRTRNASAILIDWTGGPAEADVRPLAADMTTKYDGWGAVSRHEITVETKNGSQTGCPVVDHIFFTRNG